MHPSKIFTDILEHETFALDYQRALLIKNDDFVITETAFKKLFFKNFGRVSLSTYNKYLKEMKDGTYIRCERGQNETN